MIMLKVFLAFLLGFAEPSSIPVNENCNEDCTEESHTCENQNEPNPGDIGYIPPKK